MVVSGRKLLLLDTNIISHALAKNQTVAYAALFRKYEATYTFCVTGFSQYELLCSSSKEHQENTKTYISQNLALVELSQTLMDFSARVNNLYSTHKSTKGLKISHGDIINASFSIAKNIPLMTIDNNDYPTPFFKELARERINYESKKDREIMDTIYIVEPDLDNIEYCFKLNNL